MIFLIFGMLMNFPLVLADNDTGQGNGSSSNVISADNDSDNETDVEDEEDKDNICCHIFGYGAEMEIVNSRYELMDEEECEVPKNFVGGGKEVVSRKRCEEGYAIKVQTALQARNRLRINQSELPEGCETMGSVIKCNIDGGRVMAVMAGESGNTILKFNGDNVSTKAELYHHNGEVYGVFGNESKIIEYFPEQLRERIRERTRAQLNNTKITLNENGEYEYQAEKESKFLGIFKVKERMKWTLDPETGEITKERGPWWRFLASDVEE